MVKLPTNQTGMDLLDDSLLKQILCSIINPQSSSGILEGLFFARCYSVIFICVKVRSRFGGLM